MPDSIFSQFTNQYELSKTLRFELKPVGNTRQMLEDAQVFEKDRLIQKKYQQTKPFFDELHRDFIKHALAGVRLDFGRYFEIFRAWQNDKKNPAQTKALQAEEQNLRKAIVQALDAAAKNWAENDHADIGFKKKSVEMFFEEEVFSLLHKLYGDRPEAQIVNNATGEVESIFKGWKGFTGYFTKFQETRKNLYKDDGTATAIATRIVDQNLRRFCENLALFEKLKEKVDFSEAGTHFGKQLSEVFSLDFYNACCLQQGISFYNAVIGGDSTDQNKKGLNQYINLHRQQTKEKLPFFKELDKQILSEKDKFVDAIESDEQLHDALKKFVAAADQKINIFTRLLRDLRQNPSNYKLTDIYISREALNTIAHRWADKTAEFERLLHEAMKGDKLSKYEKKEESYKFPDFIALAYIQTALGQVDLAQKFWKDRHYLSETGMGGVLRLGEPVWQQFLQIYESEFSDLLRKTVVNTSGNPQEIGYAVYKSNIDRLISQPSLSVLPDTKIIIKDFADRVLAIYQMAKYFAVEKKRKWNPDNLDLGDFYTHTEFGYEKFYQDAYQEIVQGYNALRNYLTRKPWQDAQKWKLNFENSTLANGWDKNKEADNSAIILRKEGKYYLGLMKKGCNQLFQDNKAAAYTPAAGQPAYEKMVYKFFPDQAKMFPKVCFSEKGLQFFQPSAEIWDIYKSEAFKKGDSFSLAKMHRLIDFYKDALTKYEGWKCYSFQNLKPTPAYKDNIGEFFRDVATDGYQISFQPVSEEYIDRKNQSGELYLFQIKNKDWNEGATGAKNLHTLYFENLFSLANHQLNFPLKLNGQAEIFYRPKTDRIEKEAITTKVKGLILQKGERAFHKQRYLEDKIFFHVPMAFNRGRGAAMQFNSRLNDFLAVHPEINILGVDRGEKHLAYYAVVNRTGQMLRDPATGKAVSGSLNLGYLEKLEEKAKHREQARRDWQAIEQIKDLKKGYISQVVRVLADLAIKHNAIIVFEDLNMRFKQIRGGIEKSIYQQLEKALIDKLSFLVAKGETDPQKAGHLLKAYQLAAPFTSFQEMGKQTGIIFYTQASYTSKIDPVTGWRPNLYLKYANAPQAKADFLKFRSVRFVSGRFEFTYDLKDFQKAEKFPQKTLWTVCSCVERLYWNRKLNNNQGDYKRFPDITEKLSELFQTYGIDYEHGNILDQITKLPTDGNEKFFKDLLFWLNLIFQIRNTDTKAADADGADFIMSPVEPFFDSRRAKEFGSDLPQNGDENGAYNIARKGAILLQRIEEYFQKNDSCAKMKWDELYISHTDWDDYVQQ